MVSELWYTSNWLRRNVSDYSAYAHRQRVLKRLLGCLSSVEHRKMLLTAERVFVNHMIEFYPGKINNLEFHVTKI